MKEMKIDLMFNQAKSDEITNAVILLIDKFEKLYQEYLLSVNRKNKLNRILK
jgi:hypothetical protein